MSSPVEEVQAGPGTDHVTLECGVEGEPPPALTWYRGDAPLVRGDRVNFRQAGSRHSLVLTEVSLDTFGNYSCLARNILGSSK